MRLNYKLSAALIIVSAVPITTIALVIQKRGFSHLLAERGVLYHAEADALARSVALTVDREVDKLRSFCDISVVAEQQLTLANNSAQQLTPTERAVREQRIDAEWTGMSATDEPLNTIINSPLARQLNSYQTSNPLANEIFVTDRFGRVIAATRKTTDYMQNDEAWWQKGAVLSPGETWFDQLHYDQSAEVYSLDMVRPLFAANGEFHGILKAVYNVAPLFASIPPPPDERSDQIDIVRADGAVLARIRQPGYTPLTVTMPSSAMTKARDETARRWFLNPLDDTQQERMIGVARVTLTQSDVQTSDSTREIFILISIPADSITVPIRKELKQFLIGSTLILALCLGGAVFYVRVRITRPLELLRDGTRTISMSARLRNDHGPGIDHIQARQIVAELQKIHTNDEIEELASSFATMSSRVLRYHRHLESEVAEKTALIHEDLELAKEFQEAMLPDHYPTVPFGGAVQNMTGDQLSLHFWHLYQPAASLGGDFFDMFQISEHQAGLFVADVMGHGSRSALVTAILRALLPGSVKAAADPGEFMAELNNHFVDIIQRSGQTIFVTAFFIVLNTRDKTATYVTAGHPSPVRANRRTGAAQLLMETIRNQPALGLIKDTRYTNHSRALAADDIFLIFTDGLIEAENTAGEMFGEKQLLESVRKYMHLPIDELSHKVASELDRFIGNKPMGDDLCLVTVEATHSDS